MLAWKVDSVQIKAWDAPNISEDEIDIRKNLYYRAQLSKLPTHLENFINEILVVELSDEKQVKAMKIKICEFITESKKMLRPWE